MTTAHQHVAAMIIVAIAALGTWAGLLLELQTTLQSPGLM